MHVKAHKFMQQYYSLATSMTNGVQLVTIIPVHYTEETMP